MVMQQQDLVSQGGQGEQSASLCLQNKVLLHVQTPGCPMHCSIAVAASGSPFLNTRQYIVLQFASSGFRLATFGDCIVATLACCCHCGLRFWSETYLHGLSTEEVGGCRTIISAVEMTVGRLDHSGTNNLCFPLNEKIAG